MNSVRFLPDATFALLLLLAPALPAESVVESWVQRYRGPGTGNHILVDVAVDASGDVVVTGQSDGDGSDLDFYTAKYAAADGAILWEKRYNGPGNGEDVAFALALDASGNAVVTGHSAGSSGNADFYTAKYAAGSGELLWERRYNGPADGDDRAVDVAVDASGNVVVTGNSTENDVDFDCYTAKYAAATGEVFWEHVYKVAGKREAHAMTLDASGNAVVTGGKFSVLSGADYFTAKYAAADGALLWEKTYSGSGGDEDIARAVAVDASGNVVVTGTSIGLDANQDCYSAKYAADDGEVLWEHRYDGPARGSDYGQAVAVDAFGNVVVAGSSDGGKSGFNYNTIKYSGASGAIIWERRSASPGNLRYDELSAMALDASGNPVVTGFSNGDGTYFDFYTAKYAGTTGTLIWEQRYTYPSSESDEGGYAVAVDASGNVAVSGYSFGDGYHFAATRYHPVSSIDAWKIAHLGSSSAADLDDPDGDGLSTLAEYGMNTLPQLPDAAPLSVLPFNYPDGERLRIFLQRDPAHDDVTIEVQAAGDFGGPWVSVATSVEGASFTGAGYVGGDDAAPGVKTVEIRDTVNIADAIQRFLRVRVRR